jgi:hypothetical protein
MSPIDRKSHPKAKPGQASLPSSALQCLERRPVPAAGAASHLAEPQNGQKNFVASKGTGGFRWALQLQIVMNSARAARTSKGENPCLVGLSLS